MGKKGTLRVRIDKMIEDAANVETIKQLAELLQDTQSVPFIGVDISERTLYNWKNGKGFQSSKLSQVADKLGYADPLELIEVS